MRAASNAVTVTLTPMTALHWPILVVHDWTAGEPSSVTVGGVETLVLATVDSGSSTLSLTVATDVTTAAEIAIR